MKYYVYGLVDPRDNKIKYVGKGSGYRMFVHVSRVKRCNCEDQNYTKYTELTEILNEYEDIAYCKLFETDDEVEAYSVEAVLIEEYETLYPTGWNIKQRGHPTRGFSGKTHSEQSRLKMSEKRKGALNPMFGKKRYTTYIEYKKFCGRKHSEATKQLISAKAQERILQNKMKADLNKKLNG